MQLQNRFGDRAASELNLGSVRELPRCCKGEAASRDVTVKGGLGNTTGLHVCRAPASIRTGGEEAQRKCRREGGAGAGGGGSETRREGAWLLAGEERRLSRLCFPRTQLAVTTAPSWRYLLVIHFGPEDNVM